MEAFCRSTGTTQEATPSDTPVPKGVTEKGNQLIVKKTRCILDSNLPTSLWTEAMKIAVFYTNHISTSVDLFGCRKDRK